MKKMLLRVISIMCIICISINTYCIEVSDNDGSAFITKAEFDALKSSFQSQIDTYNQSIDSKIDTAIASYLSGISIAKEADLQIKSQADKVYCMQYKTSSETKDMKYSYVRPYINYTNTGWARWTSQNATYGWYFVFKPNTKLTTGTRLYIKNTIDSSSSFAGCAEWDGYATGVSEMQTWICDDVAYNSGWGYHIRTGGIGMGMNHCAPIKNTVNSGRNWIVGYPGIDIYYETRGNTSLTSAKDYFNIYVLNLSRSETAISNKNLIIWQPETYYCFTENDKLRDYMFDAKASISGWDTSNTSAEKTYMDITRPTTMGQEGKNDFKELFTGATSASMSYHQKNISEGWKSDTSMVDIKSYINTSLTDYGYTNYRQPYTMQGFPWYSINNWKQLYCSANDWAAVAQSSKTNSSLIHPPSSTTHVSLMGGWPIIDVTKSMEYKYEIEFEDTVDHVVWAKLEPFTTNDANTEAGTIKWESATPLATGFKNAALVTSGNKITLDFKTEDDGVLYLKWAKKPSSGTTCTGGGTIKLAKTIKQISKDE